MRTDSELQAEESVTLTFDGDKVSGIWFRPELSDLICKLCGKGPCDIKCVNANPYCG
jgi:hypothetical protein